jgi:hypothetical protein
MNKVEIMELAESVNLADNGLITNGDYTDELCKFFRLAYARGMLKQEEQSKHWSDCATNSEPAYPSGECDCGGYTLEKDAQMLLKEIANIVRTKHIYGPEMKILLEKEEAIRARV